MLHHTLVFLIVAVLVTAVLTLLFGVFSLGGAAADVARAAGWSPFAQKLAFFGPFILAVSLAITACGASAKTPQTAQEGK